MSSTPFSRPMVMLIGRHRGRERVLAARRCGGDPVAQYLQADVVVTPISSNTAVEKCGLFKTVLRTRIGSPYVIEGMAQVGGSVIVGYEANGGFLLGSDVVRKGRRITALPTRDAVLPMLALLCMARERGCRLSELTKGLPHRFTASDRLQNFAIEASHALIARLSADLAYVVDLMAPDAGEVMNVDTTDGLRVTFANGDIVHLRPSGNAPSYAATRKRIRWRVRWRCAMLAWCV